MPTLHKTNGLTLCLSLFLGLGLWACQSPASDTALATNLRTAIDHSGNRQAEHLPDFLAEDERCIVSLCNLFGNPVWLNYPDYDIERIETLSDEDPGFYVSAQGGDWSNHWELRHRQAAGQVLILGQRGKLGEGNQWVYRNRAWLLDYVYGKLVEVNPHNTKEVLQALPIEPEIWKQVQMDCWYNHPG